ncbi:MAG: FAD-dependent oxidoreductase [Acetobacteraceae bacterium]|nr:FAD-dependent oxidoreductase [Acetobacteraceae bacterium]
MPEASTCCIVGGGPAGMMLGYLLARAGVAVIVLEKHGDFLRDFRGDTIHPSTLRVMDELGLLDDFLTLPHQRAEHLSAQIGTQTLQLADFSHLPVRCKFIAFMPQWDFLDFLAGRGRELPHFKLRMNTAAEALIEEGGRVAGIRGHGPEGPIEVRADLVVAADGRHSAMRDAAGMAVTEVGAPIDVLWFRLPREPRDSAETFGRFDAGKLLVLINRGAHWQCGFVIPKGSLDARRERGVEAFRAEIAALQPELADRVGAIGSWDDVKLLTVAVNRLAKWWRPGLLCIGDAAHAMSPVGGIGINLAIQDAVAAANSLAAPLRERRLGDAELAAVQRRRAWPTRMTQRMQVLIQDRILRPALGSAGPAAPPALMRAFAAMPLLRRLPARVIGLGFRPEHVAQAIRSGPSGL